MAKRKYEFRPDKPHSDVLSKLYLTRKQRLSILKWALFSLLLLVLSVLQDVILCRLSLFGATTDLVPCAIFLVCVLLGTEDGCVFTLIAAALYQFSGTAPGYHVIALIPVIALALTMFRQSYLRKSMSADLLCAGAAMLIYEASVFFAGLLLSLTVPARFWAVLLTTALSVLVMPILYPVVSAVGKIGGETWKE